ncbi:MAG: hypothetical protein A3G34_09415 [Candidatus Lindowbacteria bacterium RIFCSPLOWO2_12_FULL_62_27]|nr:MAG: hypothetical protein A3I06_08080 [Candidatus Lindowbacteria bacterium RIFCSPLOWO2_02_FULL_62_12]OGH60255.1 MAG: hypothetical protein A3G34_09415 [Candidatus Lindowbacteria bacterium RIFCSPLOWO2_12_FULL_62_27]
MRTMYGLWQEKRWLRSFISEFLGNEKTPAPLKDQAYADQPAGGGTNAPPEGHPLVTIDDLDYDEKDYDRSDGQEKIVVSNRREFMERLTREDPWRKERRWVNVGGEARYQYVDYKEGTPYAEKKLSYVSFADVGVRVKPFRRYLNLVVENRFVEKDPPKARIAELFNSGPNSVLRSAYVLVDQMPFNTFAMYGVYFPLFGHYTPDRSSLAQSLAGFTLRSGYRAFSVGTAPNVPFLNLHFFGPQKGDGRDQARGFAYNLGGRFVTFGAYFMISGWKSKSAVTQLKKDLYSLTGGMSHKRLTANFELLKVRRHLAAGSARSRVYTLETKTRLWRQNYAEVNFAKSNVSVTSAPGSAYEFAYGFKNYLLPGVQLETLMNTLSSRTAGGARSKERRFQTQLHLFY